MCWRRVMVWYTLAMVLSGRADGNILALLTRVVIRSMLQIVRKPL